MVLVVGVVVEVMVVLVLVNLMFEKFGGDLLGEMWCNFDVYFVVILSMLCMVVVLVLE